MKKNYFILFVLLIFNLHSQIENGRVAFYPLDGDAIDISSNQLNGTLIGAVPANDRNNNLNSALTFDGVNDYVSLPNSQLLKPQFPFSIAFWAKINESEATVFYTSDYIDQYYYGFWVGITLENEVHINFGDGGNSGTSSRQSKVASQLLPVGSWHHILCVVRSANDMDIYIDCENAGGNYSGEGELQMVYSSSASPRLCNAVAQSALDPTFMNGSIDELMIWNREVTLEELKSFCRTSSLKAEEELALNVYPNPAEEELNLSSEYNKSKYEILTLLGETIKKGKITNSEIDIKELSNGQYLLKIESSKRVIKFIKQ
ncbi:MAG: T9SS type A sorting domain-containing protein [Flavobacteriia bacterium]|nr:T9SS type A sorting domain-containing protein [Flavobacteriia bacterium]